MMRRGADAAEPDDPKQCFEVSRVHGPIKYPHGSNVYNSFVMHCSKINNLIAGLLVERGISTHAQSSWIGPARRASRHLLRDPGHGPVHALARRRGRLRTGQDGVEI